jgi:hypothetical protein
VTIGERDPLLERLGRHLSLEHGLMIGGALVLASLSGLCAVVVEWGRAGFGALGRAYETAVLVTAFGLGVQIVFGAFFLALLTMRTVTTAVPVEAVSLREVGPNPPAPEREPALPPGR